MDRLTADNLARIFRNAEDASSAIRSIVRHYRAADGDSEANTFIIEKTVQHFRNNGKPDGVYRLGHGLELVLGENSLIQEEPPF
jgi:hypothetical protein